MQYAAKSNMFDSIARSIGGGIAAMDHPLNRTLNSQLLVSEGSFHSVFKTTCHSQFTMNESSL
jgi:hypothetical protein